MRMRKVPPVGKRIIKSAVGVALCYLIYFLRGKRGTVFYSQLAVLWCMQPYVDNSIKNGIQRVIGTMIGAAYGILVIILDIYLLPQVFSKDVYYYLLVSAMIAPIIHTTVWMRRKNASYFSAVVFLSIVVNHITDPSPLLFVFNRVTDTMLGIVLGVCINIVRIPRKKQRDILFVSGVDDTLLSPDETLSAYSRIELNRMLDDGAQFTVSTMRTPASIIDALDGIHWKLPMIVMDGAALYDMNQHSFLRTVHMDISIVSKVKSFFKEEQMNCFMNVVIDDTLAICYESLNTEVERSIFKTLNNSPYRNFIQMDLSMLGDVLYFMAVGDKERMDKIVAHLREQAWYQEIKVLYYPSTTYPGNMYLKLYDRMADRKNMIEELKKRTGLSKTVTFGTLKNQYDIVIHANDCDKVVKTLQKIYEPYFFSKLQKTVEK